MGAASALQANGVTLNGILESYKKSGKIVYVYLTGTNEANSISGTITNINLEEGWFEVEDSTYKQVIFTSWVSHISVRG